MNTQDTGLYNKFTVIRTDGHSAPGEKHESCTYFVLDLDHDPYAQEAALLYAVSITRENPTLSDDLINYVGQHELPKPDDKAPSGS